MAIISSIDIMSSLNDAVGAIKGLKIDLSLPETTPFARQIQRMKQNQELMDKMTEVQKIKQERNRLKAVAIQQAASGGAGTEIRAPARIRNRI